MDEDTPPITIAEDALVPVKPKYKPTFPIRKPLTHETIEQRAWFVEYVKLGNKRSIPKIAEMSGRDLKTIYKWSSKFHWVARSQEEDRKLLDSGDGVETHDKNLKRKKLVLDLADYLIKHSAIVDEKTGEVTGANISIKNILDLRAVIDLRDEQLGINKNKTVAGTTNIDKAVFIIKK